MWWCVQGMLRICWMSSAVNFWCPSLVVPCCTTVVPIFVSLWTFSPSGNFCTGLRGRPIVCDLNKSRDVVQSVQVWYSEYSNTFQTVFCCVLFIGAAWFRAHTSLGSVRFLHSWFTWQEESCWHTRGRNCQNVRWWDLTWSSHQTTIGT